MARRSPIVLAAAIVALGSCGPAQAPRGARSLPPERTWTLQEAASGPEVEALVGRFYSPELDREAIERELAALLERYPGAAGLHEVAALLATLRDDDHAAWSHWMSAAADLRSPLTELDLAQALDRELTGRELGASIGLLEQVAARHPRPAARYAARVALVSHCRWVGRFDEAAAHAAQLGTIDAWLVVGPFDNDQGSGFRTRFGPEDGVDLARSYQGLTVPVRWAEVEQLDPEGRVPLAWLYERPGSAVAYLATFVRSERAVDAQLRLSVDAPVRAWVNGALVASEEHLAAAGPDNVVVPIRLERGWNALLVKSADQGGAPWRVSARLTDREGAPLEGLELSARPQPGPRSGAGEGTATRAELHVLGPELAAVSPPARRLALELRALSQAGLYRAALRRAQDLLAALPGHPLAIYDGVAQHGVAGEQGRMIELLNLGVERWGGWATAFLRGRARFYLSTRMLDRAQQDLDRALALSPRSRSVRMQLAEAYGDQTWPEAAARALEAVLADWPDSGLAVQVLAAVTLGQGYRDRARSLLARARELEPGNPAVIERLLADAVDRGDHAGALALADALRELQPARDDTLMTRANVLRVAGRRDEARELLEQVAARRPTWAEPRERLADMADEDGEIEAAIAGWRRALELDPGLLHLAERIDLLESRERVGVWRHAPDDAAIAAAVARARELDVMAGTDVVYLLDDEVTAVRANGHADGLVTQVWLAVTTDGRDYLIAHYLHPGARIVQAYMVAPDGRRQEPSSIRGDVVRFSGVEEGSVTVVQYVYHDQGGAFLPNHYFADWFFQGENVQTDRARWRLMVPEGEQLALRVVGGVERQETHEGGARVLTFTASDVPPLVGETAMVPPIDLLWQVNVSTVASWLDYVQWELALMSQAFESNAEIASLARRLTEGAATRREALDRLYHFVAQEIRYQQDYENTIAGVRPHSAAVVLERGYGDCKDKAVLLVTLARELGLDLHFAVLRTRDAGEVVREIPNQQFNHAIAYVPAQEGIDEPFFMDATTDGLDLGNLRDDDQGALALVIDPRTERYQFIRVAGQGPEMQVYRESVAIDLRSAVAATAAVSIVARGTAASQIRLDARNTEVLRQLREETVAGLFGAGAITASDIRNHDDILRPVELDLTVDVGAALQANGRDVLVPLPTALPEGEEMMLAARQTPLRLPPPETRELRFALRLPRGARVPDPPLEVAVEHPCFTMRRSVTSTGAALLVNDAFRRTCTEVAPADYPALRRAYQQAMTQLDDSITVELGR